LLTPWLDESGEIIEVRRHTVDVTERKLAEETLRASEAYLAEAQRLSHTRKLGLERRHQAVFWSVETFKFFASIKCHSANHRSFLQRVHPDDRASIERVEVSFTGGTTRIQLPHRSSDKSINISKALPIHPQRLGQVM